MDPILPFKQKEKIISSERMEGCFCRHQRHRVSEWKGGRRDSYRIVSNSMALKTHWRGGMTEQRTDTIIRKVFGIPDPQKRGREGESIAAHMACVGHSVSPSAVPTIGANMQRVKLAVHASSQRSDHDRKS